MTFEEFKKVIDGDLYSWIAKYERSPKHWMLSLEDYASMRYNEEHKKEDNLRKKNSYED